MNQTPSQDGVIKVTMITVRRKDIIAFISIISYSNKRTVVIVFVIIHYNNNYNDDLIFV